MWALGPDGPGETPRSNSYRPHGQEQAGYTSVSPSPWVQLLGWRPHSELLYAEGLAGAWHTVHVKTHYHYFLATSRIISSTQVLSKMSKLLPPSVLASPEAGGEMLPVPTPSTALQKTKPNQTLLYAKSEADSLKEIFHYTFCEWKPNHI